MKNHLNGGSKPPSGTATPNNTSFTSPASAANNTGPLSINK